MNDSTVSYVNLQNEGHPPTILSISGKTFCKIAVCQKANCEVIMSGEEGAHFRFLTVPPIINGSVHKTLCEFGKVKMFACVHHQPRKCGTPFVRHGSMVSLVEVISATAPCTHHYFSQLAISSQIWEYSSKRFWRGDPNASRC